MVPLAPFLIVDPKKTVDGSGILVEPHANRRAVQKCLDAFLL